MVWFKTGEIIAIWRGNAKGQDDRGEWVCPFFRASSLPRKIRIIRKVRKIRGTRPAVLVIAWKGPSTNFTNFTNFTNGTSGKALPGKTGTPKEDYAREGS